jgi:ADP-heptose:LPS heptosyltransferase
MKSKAQRPRTKARNQIDWSKVKRLLVVRLRSIGDTVLSTPSLIALRRFLPDAQIDVLLEDWVAPVLDGFDAVDNVISVPTKATLKASEGKLSSKELLFVRSIIARELRKTKYDVAFNLHGGTTATFFVRASGAKHRVGFANYRYNFLYTHLAPSPLEFWQTEHAHSAEQQLALLGFFGVPVSDRPKSRLVVNESARNSIEKKLSAFDIQPSAFALLIRSPRSMRSNGRRKTLRASRSFCAKRIYQSSPLPPEKSVEFLKLSNKYRVCRFGFTMIYHCPKSPR